MGLCGNLSVTSSKVLRKLTETLAINFIRIRLTSLYTRIKLHFNNWQFYYINQQSSGHHTQGEVKVVVFMG